MKQIRGWWLPNDEMHLAELLSRSDLVDGRGTYQYDKLETAVSYCKRFDLAVDVGANVGLWAWHLAKRFKQVEAFEPMPQHQTCFLWNMEGNFSLNRLALGDREARVGMKADAQGTPSCMRVDPIEGAYHMATLDGCRFEAPVNFLKIDCEGFEVFVVQGGEKTIRRDHPVICIEQKRGHGRKYGLDDQAGIKLLESWGYKTENVMRGDYIMVWSG